MKFPQQVHQRFSIRFERTQVIECRNDIRITAALNACQTIEYIPRLQTGKSLSDDLCRKIMLPSFRYHFTFHRCFFCSQNKVEWQRAEIIFCLIFGRYMDECLGENIATIKVEQQINVFYYYTIRPSHNPFKVSAELFL